MTKYYRKGIIFCLAVAAIIAVLASGCQNDNEITMPTFSVPTPTPTISATGAIMPTPTPNSEEEIHFGDVRLENIVRDKIGKNIGPIMRADVENITVFSARVEGIYSVDGLQYFTSLEELDLYGNRISDLTPVSSLTSLKKLNLGKNYNVLSAGSSDVKGLDITPLKTLSLLEEVDLSDNMLSNIDTLRSLPLLKRVVLTGNRIDDITPLSACKNIKYVDLSYNYGYNDDNTERGIVDLSPLYEISSLETLIANYNIIADVTGIEKLTELKYIDLSENFVSDITPISKLPKVETVILNRNSLVSIAPLRNNETIKTLDVSQNMITHFDVILTMKNLQELNWAQNNIQNYKPIDKFEENKNEPG
ncbi:MAG: leucine-rich repeat domain-containing protein [Ruminococcaceae bacterium]|nr:leucine-rich repeat domain-containing protein [Oscillospiraceae bacterium]